MKTRPSRGRGNRRPETPVPVEDQTRIREMMLDLRYVLGMSQEEFQVALISPREHLRKLELGTAPWTVEKLRVAASALRSFLEVRRAQQDAFLAGVERAIALLAVNFEERGEPNLSVANQQ